MIFSIINNNVVSLIYIFEAMSKNNFINVNILMYTYTL